MKYVVNYIKKETGGFTNNVIEKRVIAREFLRGQIKDDRYRFLKSYAAKL